MADRSMNAPEDPESVRAKMGAALDARIALALETAPQLEIPADFAAALAATLPAIVFTPVTPRRHGRNAAIVCVAILLALIFFFARSPAPMSPIWISVESIFCIQFALIAVWLAVRDLGSYFDRLSE